MQPQGWYRDPYGTHDHRWFSDGKPTSLVRDPGRESYDAPPEGLPLPALRGRPPGERPPPARVGRDRRPWRWWTVVLPGALTLAPWLYTHFFAGLDGIVSALVLNTPVIALVSAGLTVPRWRRPIAVALWVALALTCFAIWQALRAFGSWA